MQVIEFPVPGVACLGAMNQPRHRGIQLRCRR